MTSRRQNTVLSLLPRECNSVGIFGTLFSCMQGKYQYRQKVHFKKLQVLAVAYNMGFLSLSFRRCLNGSVFFSLFDQFLENEMTWRQPIIVRECIFKN